MTRIFFPHPSMYADQAPAWSAILEARATCRVLHEDVETILRSRSVKSGYPVEVLQRVFERGVAAWQTQRSAVASESEWGLARVFEFLSKGSTGDRDVAEDAGKPADKPALRSCCVMLPIPLDIAQKYAYRGAGAEDSADAHMTLYYLGRVEDDVIEQTKVALQKLAAKSKPFDGVISGIGRFTGEKTDPLYLSLDSPGLPAFREAVVAAVPNTPQTHGFTPHITLAYLPKEIETPPIVTTPDVVRFERVELWVEDTRFAFPFKVTESRLSETSEWADIHKAFHRSVNMTPSEILKWADDPRASCASFPSTLRRLPALAALKEKPLSKWTKRDANYAKRVLAFNTRMDGMRSEWGDTVRIVVSLRNWGRKVGTLPADCARNAKHKR